MEREETTELLYTFNGIDLNIERKIQMRGTKLIRIASVLCIAAAMVGIFMIIYMYSIDTNLVSVGSPSLQEFLLGIKGMFVIRPVYYLLAGILGLVITKKTRGSKFLLILGIILVLFSVVSSFIAPERTMEDKSLLYFAGLLLYSFYSNILPILYLIGSIICRVKNKRRRF